MKSRRLLAGILLLAFLALGGCMHLVTQQKGAAPEEERPRGGYGY